MKVRHFPLFLGLISGAIAADVPPVIAPTKRAESLDQAKAMLAARDSAAPKELKNPFNSEAFATAAGVTPAAGPAGGQAATGGATAPGSGAATRPAGPRSARELVSAISEGLKPSGFLTLRGAPTLLFGQKRVKAGDSMSITFEGTEYTVVISAIQPPNFTLRLNNEEFTRPIK